MSRKYPYDFRRKHQRAHWARIRGSRYDMWASRHHDEAHEQYLQNGGHVEKIALAAEVRAQGQVADVTSSASLNSGLLEHLVSTPALQTEAIAPEMNFKAGVRGPIGVPGTATAARSTAAALLADFAAGVGIIVAIAASGLGTAQIISKTRFKDNSSLNSGERDARKFGRFFGWTGGGVGAAATLAWVYLAGEVGIGVVGVTTGFGVIGGGSALVGAAVVLAAPAAVAAVGASIGYGGYKLVAWITN